MTGSRTSPHQDAEDRMREVLQDGGLAQPDEVTYEFDPDEVVFFWRDSKLAVIIELDEEPGLDRAPGEARAGLERTPGEVRPGLDRASGEARPPAGRVFERARAP